MAPKILAPALVALALSFDASASSAKVRIEVVNGEKVILNEPTEAKARRLSTTFAAVPDNELLPRIDHYSKQAGLDPRLVRAVVQVESGYNSRALSNKGAMGLMQLMPGTAQLFAVSDPYDPDQNLRAGTSYLKRLLDSFQGRIEHALAGYNAGPGAVEKYRGVPPYRETKEYLERVLGLYQGHGGGLGRRVFVTREAGRGIVITTEPGSSR